MKEVRSMDGTPTASEFGNSTGTPLVVKTTDAAEAGYILNAAGEVVKLADANAAAGRFADGIVLPKTAGVGIKTDLDAPTYVWKDLLGIIQPKTSGVGSPTLATFRGGQVRRFCYAAGEDGDGEFHIPHDWAPGTDLFMHVHWGHNGTGVSGALTINWFFTYAKGHNQDIFSAEIAPIQTIGSLNLTLAPQYCHRIDEFQLSAASPSATQLDTDNIEVDGLIMYHYDVAVIPTITGGSPNKPFLFYMDLHYQSTNTGTKQKAPNFYV